VPENASHRLQLATFGDGQVFGDSALASVPRVGTPFDPESSLNTAMDERPFESAAGLVSEIVGPGRGFGLYTDRDGILTLIIETMTSMEHERIEAAVGEKVNLRLGGRVRRMPKRSS